MHVAPCTLLWRFRQPETLPLWLKKAEHSSLLQAGGAALQMEVWKCLQLKYLNASLRKTIVAAKPKVRHSSHVKLLLPYSVAQGGLHDTPPVPSCYRTVS